MAEKSPLQPPVPSSILASMNIEESEYYKWRTLIGMAHVDKRFMREEQSFLKERIEKNAPAAMVSQLMKEMMEDMFSPRPPDVLFDRIADPKHKVETLIMSHELFWADGNLHEDEREIFTYMIRAILKGETAKAQLDAELASWDTSDEERKDLKEMIENVCERIAAES